MFCSRCGNNLPEGAVFCSKCGNKFEKIEEKKRRTNPKSKKIIMAIIGCCVGLSVLVYFVLFNSVNTNSNRIMIPKPRTTDSNLKPIFEYELNNENNTAKLVRYHGKNVPLKDGSRTELPDSEREKKVIIPKTIKKGWRTYDVIEIGDRAFDGCDSLTNIEIPESVTTIGDFAFEHCDSLTNIEIPEGVTIIEYGTFIGCDSLTNIEIPESVTTIRGFAFENCDSLTNIEIPESVTTIGNSAFFDCDSLTNIEIPESVTKIGDLAFGDCENLSSVSLPADAQLGKYVFGGCYNLPSVGIWTY